VHDWKSCGRVKLPRGFESHPLRIWLHERRPVSAQSSVTGSPERGSRSMRRTALWLSPFQVRVRAAPSRREHSRRPTSRPPCRPRSATRSPSATRSSTEVLSSGNAVRHPVIRSRIPSGPRLMARQGGAGRARCEGMRLRDPDGVHALPRPGRGGGGSGSRSAGDSHRRQRLPALRRGLTASCGAERKPEAGEGGVRRPRSRA
jgi:hypothetical protein